MEAILNGGFHEATVTSLAVDGSTVTIGLEGVYRDDGIQDVIVILLGVRETLVDGVLNERVAMESDDGEVLTLDQTGNLIELIVLWNEYSPRKSITVSYSFVCDVVRIHPARPVETS